MQKIFAIILSVLIFIACSENKQQAELASITVTDITAKTSEYVGKTVSLTGTVVHVCKHGGKRLFMVGEDSKQRFKVTAGTGVGSFDVKLEGSDIVVTGLVEEQRVDEAYLNSWEEEITPETKPEVGHEGHDKGEEEEDHEDEQKKKIENMRKKLAESGKEYLSFYSLKCESFNEL
jgi:hypothetical protein